MAIEDRPLVTFGLVAYNQEKYIREAFEAALAQDYSPLEVICSDDCSTDNTWEIIQSISSSYSGAHTVQLNRNEVNLGLVPHVKKVLSLSTGDPIVIAAGDDVSFPSRVGTLVDGYLSTFPRPSLVESNVIVVNEEGVGDSLHYPPRRAGVHRNSNPWGFSSCGRGINLRPRVDRGQAREDT